ncbi:NUDIX domain-containing protein [Acetomicrobium sp.]|uniref:bis(5'-nucleosyl)-tetraphosphatase n=1 Tax=Acetomicrobium sp. TaxID=1872099 RepID=UPI001BCB44B1|nr:NUDIX domain-containing protein [Acetomicrobium sp.]
MRIKTISAGAVIFYWENDKPVYLLLRAYRNWDFPKGEIKQEEHPLETAKREVAEETGLTDVIFYDDVIETPPYGKGKVAMFYIAEAKTKDVFLPISPDLGRPEHHEWKWLPYDDARTLLNERLKAILEWAHQKILKERMPNS